MLYGHARNLDVTLVAGRSRVAAQRSAEIFKLVIHNPRKPAAAKSPWRQARQGRDDWRRERYSRLFAR